MLRQKLITIQATGNHLFHAAFMKSLVDVLQSGQGRLRVAQPENRIVAAIERQTNLLTQTAAQRFANIAYQIGTVGRESAARPKNCKRLIRRRRFVFD